MAKNQTLRTVHENGMWYIRDQDQQNIAGPFPRRELLEEAWRQKVKWHRLQNVPPELRKQAETTPGFLGKLKAQLPSILERYRQRG